MTRFEVYQANWHWNEDTEKWLEAQCRGLVLNMCCGMSQIGDVRADIDLSVKPTILCDMNHAPFRKGTFDTEIVDPPFSYYRGFRWIPKVANLTRGKLILSSPLVNAQLKGIWWTTTYHLTKQHNSLFLRLWIIFTMKNHQLAM
jgi:hypothetical protein